MDYLMGFVLGIGAGFFLGYFTGKSHEAESACGTYYAAALSECLNEHSNDVAAYEACIGELPRCE